MLSLSNRTADGPAPEWLFQKTANQDLTEDQTR
jgi:hypothetical protein